MKKQKSKIILSNLIFLAISSIAFFNLSPAQAVDFTYKPMEKIPGFENVNIADFPTLVETIYKFGIWVVGICAFFMITVGGYTYMTSAGNTSAAGTGKKIITDAIIGLVLALTAYLIFYVINPNITSVDLQIAPGGTGVGSTACNGSCRAESCASLAGATNGTGSCSDSAKPNCCFFYTDKVSCVGGDCSLSACTTERPAIEGGKCGDSSKKCCSLLKKDGDCISNGVNYSTLNLCEELKRPGGCGNSICAQYLPAINKYAGGVASVAVLKAFMVIESDCDIASGSKTSYGLMQLTPSTAKDHTNGCGVSPDVIDANWLKSRENADASICIAANYIRYLATTNCGTDPRDIYAGYNSGEWCKPSKDCATEKNCKGGTMKAWECPYDNPEHTDCNEGLYQTKQGAAYINYCLNNIGF